MDCETSCRQGGGIELCSFSFPYDRPADLKKSKLKPHRSKYWKIPPRQNAAFVAAMEDVLSIYHLPYDHEYPVVSMDVSNKQLIGEVRTPIPEKNGQPKRIDDEYIRNGSAEIFMEVEPLAGKRHVAVTERRTRKDWAHQIKSMLDERYPKATKIHLIMDNLNTHNTASLYETFEPQEAQRLASQLEIHHTPKHGSWLNIAEIELSVLKGQCLDRRIADITTMKTEDLAWESHRNNNAKAINWQFTKEKSHCAGGRGNSRLEEKSGADAQGRVSLAKPTFFMPCSFASSVRALWAPAQGLIAPPAP